MLPRPTQPQVCRKPCGLCWARLAYHARVTPFTQHARRGAVLLALVTTGWLLGACSSSRSSTSPSPVGTPTPTATVASVAVSGSAPRVGTTTQFSATATLSDGTTVPVTSTASWSSSNSAAATVNAGGAVTGVAAGDADITATYQTVSGKAHVTVVRQVPATFTISGTLRDGASGGSLPNVIVEAEPAEAGATKRSATTDASGVYAISGLPPGLVTLRVTASSYQPLTLTVTVSADTRTDLVLTRVPPPDVLSLAGTWTGTGSDGLGPETFTWVLAQSGDTLSGTVRMRPLSETDGSCGSCHKVKDGTISGSVSGSAVTLKMSFALGGTQPTPTCRVTMDLSAAGVTSTNLSSTYNGSDSCEPAVALGTITMTRR